MSSGFSWLWLVLHFSTESLQTGGLESERCGRLGGREGPMKDTVECIMGNVGARLTASILIIQSDQMYYSIAGYNGLIWITSNNIG